MKKDERSRLTWLVCASVLVWLAGCQTARNRDPGSASNRDPSPALVQFRFVASLSSDSGEGCGGGSRGLPKAHEPGALAFTLLFRLFQIGEFPARCFELGQQLALRNCSGLKVIRHRVQFFVFRLPCVACQGFGFWCEVSTFVHPDAFAQSTNGGLVNIG